MPPSWQRRIDRATTLARAETPSRALLTQYASVLEAQRACFDLLALGAGRLTGSLDRDLPELRFSATRTFSTLRESLPAEIIAGAPANDAALNALLLDGWHTPSAPFLARLVLQPYAEVLAQRRRRPDGRDFTTPPRRAACPFCGGPPQVSVHRSDSKADGGSRLLICALCSTDWSMRRIVCVYCGEEDEHHLKYFHSPEFAHMRVDACDTCRHYVKAVDLTRLGIAVPVVDEVASGALDIWAHDGGYTKIERNLLGL